MSDWAIVIGVDHYPASASWTLRGAVRDAVAMREWLLSANGAHVAPDHLTLLLAPVPGLSPPVDFIPATHDNILKAITDLFDSSNKQGDRFFFHFSGHGLSIKDNLSWKQGILASDFSLTTSHKSVTVTSLFELFQRTSFQQQFFVIDACRNIPLDRIRLSDFPYGFDPVFPTCPQFVMFATQPGVEAKEVGHPGDETGAFTDALLRGLKGEGAAKTWDDDSGSYVVRWNELFSAVVDDVRNRKLQVNANGNGPLIQEPRQYGERGNENPELARLQDASVPDEELFIDLAPSPKVLPVASITINALTGLAKDIRAPIESVPIVARLRPRTYGLNGVATGYAPTKKSVRLYAPARVKLDFQEDPPGARAIAPVAPGPIAPMNRLMKGDLDVSAQESVALLQVANEAGTIIAAGRGQLVLRDLPAGFYSLRLISPEGVVVSEVVESPRPGGTRQVSLAAPPVATPAMQYLTELAGFEKKRDGSISPSETVGPTYFLKTSTVLALAAAAQLEPGSPYGFHLRKVPLPGFHQLVGMDASSGLHLVFGDERHEGFWNSARVLDITEGERREMSHEGQDSQLLTSFALATSVGPRDIRIQWPGHAAVIPCYVLPGRVTLFVVTREMDGSVEIHQYMPLSGVPGSGAPVYPASAGRDPNYGGSAFAVIRRIEYMQRTFATGRVSPLKPDVQLLLDDKWVDPIAGCLGGYLAMRMGMTDRLNIATANLVRYFGELPDAHILRGAYLASVDRFEEAGGEFRKAVDTGIPIFREGATLLANIALPLEGSLREMLLGLSARLAGGQPWSMRLSESGSLESAPASADRLHKILRILKQRGVDDPDLNLMLAVLDGDISALKAAHAAGANVNVTDSELLARYADLLPDA